MQWNRKIASGIAVVAVGSLLVGCSAAAEPTPAADETPEQTPSGEIVFWSAIPGMDAVSQAFNDSQDEITVTFEEIPNAAGGGYATLATAIAAGNGPDVAGFEYFVLPQFVGTGAVVPIDGLVSEDLLADYADGVRNLVTFSGETYGMPYDAPPMMMYYRSDVLEAAGVDVPSTWDEFEEAARAVRESNPGTYIASYNPNEPSVHAALAWQAGARWFEVEGDSWRIGIDSPESLRVAEYWQSLIDQDLVKVQNAFSDEWTADLGSGAVSGVLGASWSAAGIRARTEESGQAGQWIAAAPPTWGDSANGLYGGTSFGVTSNSENPRAAAKFIEFLTTDPRAIEARGEVGSAFLAYPGLSDIAEKVFPVDYYANDLYAAFEEALAAVSPTWQWGPNFDITATPLRDTMASIGSGGTVIEAFAATQQATIAGLQDLGISVAE